MITYTSLEQIIFEFHEDIGEYLVTGEMTEAFYNALFVYYCDSGVMPYGVMKARDGDPVQWVGDRFDHEYAKHLK